MVPGSCIVPLRLPRIPAMLHDLLTDWEVARRLTISVRTVWRWARNGYLPQPIRIGGITRWRRRDIDDYMRRVGITGAPKSQEAGSKNQRMPDESSVRGS
jgi:excisionase family DNA binding protein